MKKQKNPFESYWNKRSKLYERLIGHGMNRYVLAKLEESDAQFAELCETQKTKASEESNRLNRERGKNSDKFYTTMSWLETGKVVAFELVKPTATKEAKPK